MNRIIQILNIKKSSNPVILTHIGSVYYIMMNTKANVFNFQFMSMFNQLLDKINKDDNNNTTLIILSSGKIFSGGLDLKQASKMQKQRWKELLLTNIALLGRIALLPYPTIAYVNGPAIGAGCMLSLCCDFLFVSSESIFMIPLANHGLSMFPGWHSIIMRKLKTHQIFRDMILVGKKYSGKQITVEGVADCVIEQEQFEIKVVNLANQISVKGRNKQSFKKAKEQANKNIIESCFNRQLDVGIRGEKHWQFLSKI